MIKRTLYFVAISLILLSFVKERPLTAATKKDHGVADSVYLFAYFTGNGENGESIRFALSDDGYNYKALNYNEPVISSGAISSTGGLRDPHIIRGVDGKTFFMVATDMNTVKYGWNTPDSSMVLLKSKDLVHWQSSVVNIPKLFPAFAAVNRVWAPQTIYDKQKKQYMLYWSMRFGKGADKIYYAYATNDFKNIATEPKQLFFKPDSGACIDGDIVMKDGKYHLFFKTEGNGNGIRKAVSANLTSGYQLTGGVLNQTTEAVEGADVFKMINSDQWILMYDVYMKGKYQFCKSTDLEKFSVIDNEVSMDFHPRHGTVMHISAKEAKALRDHFAR
ncbi:glycoside hydrolase family 43 protein [Mucilaginibacter agri]|uniref:Family 43 glycosylhydrolase n=1 Tax=Mucilaginibacter agri TaxID=2695265 RepID=A0A965ZDQ5_9SPHI|nr:glycoside hydrolase family 43 protein [Mucilaginibacter agri]NCD68129.1 family 43 glycosylhydrolase [Mucilaginibacter agri]